MKIAIAQIDMRVGDLGGICSRIESQVALAAEAGARLLCVPAPLMSGAVPTSLGENPDFEHDLLRNLSDLAAAIGPQGVTCLVPALLGYQGTPFYEAFVLREGHVAPARLTAARLREGTPLSPWAPPVFEVGGLRLGVTFDFGSESDDLPSGCDLLVAFQPSGFDTSFAPSAGVAAVSDGAFSEEVEAAGVWLAWVAPVGGFGDAAFTGGSFVMDEGGRVVAQAPCFEEGLVVADVERGMPVRALEAGELPVYEKEEWLWGALRLHLRDSALAAGYARVAVALTGDLPSSLLAALAVDALGPRNVVAWFAERPDAVTPAAEAAERERVATARQVARALCLRLVERDAADLSLLLGRDAAPAEAATARREAEALSFADTARQMGAWPLSSITKTEAALAPSAPRADARAALAPFGDVYLTELEFLARARSRSSASLPARAASLAEVSRCLAAAVAQVPLGADIPEAFRGRVRTLLSALEPSQVDGALAASVDRVQPFDENPLATREPKALAVLLLMVRRGEGARRMLPPSPVVSPGAFSERPWPAGLAWSATGTHGFGRLRAWELAGRAAQRFAEEGEDAGARVRGEILGLLGDFLGISTEQQREMMSPEGQRAIREDMERFEEQIRRRLGDMTGGQQGGPGTAGGLSFFSDN